MYCDHDSMVFNFGVFMNTALALSFVGFAGSTFGFGFWFWSAFALGFGFGYGCRYYSLFGPSLNVSRSNENIIINSEFTIRGDLNFLKTPKVSPLFFKICSDFSTFWPSRVPRNKFEFFSIFDTGSGKMFVLRWSTSV